ncbi:hypothetical protein [Paenochrobactrum pullorum]|uniref:hypothetical protein n=1 Tax=Paenochrobactrum pullorum TaxID=1324351 RepID=UPI0035BC1715
MQNRIMIDPSVALMELTIDANYSRDRRLFLAHELHHAQLKIQEITVDLASAQEEIARLNQVVTDLQGDENSPADTKETE